MELSTHEYVLKHTVIEINGRIDAFNVADLRTYFAHVVDSGAQQIIVDLKEVSFLDSAGMAALVSLLKRVRQSGGDVALVWPNLEAAQRRLRLTRFDQVFVMLESAADGLPVGAA